MEDIQNQLTNTSDCLPHPGSSSHSSSTQATTVVVHCDKSKCNYLIVNSLIRELRIRGLAPLDILISITDDLVKRILSSSCPKGIILLHVCEHSKNKIKSCVRSIKENTTSEKNVFVFGNSKIDLTYFNEFHCYAIHNDIDIHRLAEIISGNVGILEYDVEVAIRGPDELPENDDAQIKAAISCLNIRDKDLHFNDVKPSGRVHDVCSLDRKTLQHQKRCRSFEGMKIDISKEYNSTQVQDTIGVSCNIREECVRDTMKEPRNRMVEAQLHETMIRRLTPPVTNDNNKRNPTYDSTNCNFIDSVTLQNKDDMSGTFIRDSFCLLEVKCDSQMDRKLRLYMKNSGFEKYHRDILTRIIPELRKKQDIRNLSEWLHFDNYRIKDKILCEMENLLLNTSSQRMSIHDLICMVDNILNCCFQKLIQADDTLFLPLRVLTLCFVILYILNSRTARTSAYIQIQNISTRTHSNLNTLKRNASSMAGGQINLLLSLIEFSSENNFHMGIPDDALSQLSQEIVLKEFIPLDYANKFVYIFILINKMLQKSSEKAEELLSIVLKCTFDVMSKKQKTRQALHPLLYIVNKGIVLRLTKGPDSHTNWNESKQCLLTSIGIFLASSRLDLIWRCKLLETIEPLLFVADKDIVKEVIRVFGKCGLKQKQIRNVIFKHVQTLLSAANLRIFSFKKETVAAEKPAWCEFPGKIWNDLNVTLHLLIPTVSCLASGSMEDYRNLADEKETKKRINCLEIMRLLQYDKNHPNFVKLIGYQYRPLPLFYLTECHKSLHTFLLEKRQYHKWLPREKLGKMAIDATSALQFVHSKGVVHRNVTIYSFSINERETIKLHDFSLSKMLQDEGSDTNSYINAVDIEDVPVLWSAPESILEDKYDFRTDTWMLGMLIYGLYTHGGMSYTVPGLTTEQILEYIIFQELKPTKWPCIPMDVFKAIMSCVHTNPDNREDLNHIQKTMEDHLSECKEAKLDRLSSLFDMDKMYPPPTSSQPEKGLPPHFARLKQNLDPRRSYYNIRTSRIRPTKCCITQADLTAPDTPIWNGQEHARYLMVEEPVTQQFVEDELPQLSRHLCMNVLKMTALPNKLKRQGQNVSDFEYVLHYKCHKGQNVIDIALGNYVGAPGIDTTDIFYLGLTYNLVKFVQRMHSHQWLLRDLCGYSIFVDPNTLTVFMPRIGRFRRMNQSVKLDDCLLDDSFEDRIRWLPIEVIQNGLYSKESDIYMLGMTIWEIYTALDLYKHNHAVSPLEGKPFATIPKDELLTELYSGGIPSIPSSCPSWLYEMLQSCWNRNRTFRPSVEHLLTEIKKRIVQNPRKDQIAHMINFKTIPSVVYNTSMASKSRSAIVDDKDPYLSMLHVQSRQNSVEAPSESKSNASGSYIEIPILSSQSLNKYDGNDKREDCYTEDVNDPILRRIPGRNRKGYEPSGYYDNATDSECFNLHHSDSLHPLLTDNIQNDESLDISSHHIDKESQQVQHSLQTNNVSENNTSNFGGKLSRIDSGIEDDVINQQRLIGGAKLTLIPAIPERRPAGIPPIPLSKPTNILHQNIHPEMQTKALEVVDEADISKCMNHSNYRLSSNSISIGIPDTTNKLVNNQIHTSLEKSKSSMVPTFPSSHAVLSSKMLLPSKDDIVARKIEPRLVRYGSCDFLRTDRNAGLMQKRESYI